MFTIGIPAATVEVRRCMSMYERYGRKEKKYMKKLVRQAQEGKGEKNKRIKN